MWSLSDYGLITLLYQDSMGGLEVNGVGGEWIDAKPIEGSVLINVGDMLEIFTSGRLPATMHRVRVPQEEVQRKTSRQSVVFFVHLNNDSIVRPLTAFPNVNHLHKYQEVTALQHVIKRFESAKGKNWQELDSPETLCLRILICPSPRSFHSFPENPSINLKN